MSVRAYRRITAPIWNDESTFNLWSDKEVMDFLESLSDINFFTGQSGEVFEIEIDIKELKRKLKTATFDKEIVQAFKEDIKETERAGEDWLTYECF